MTLRLIADHIHKNPAPGIVHSGRMQLDKYNPTHTHCRCLRDRQASLAGLGKLYEGGGGKALEPTEAWGAAAGRGKGTSIQTGSFCL